MLIRTLNQKRKALLLRLRTRSISSVQRLIRKSRTAEQTCHVRKDVFSRKKKISTEKPIIWRKRKTHSIRR